MAYQIFPAEWEPYVRMHIASLYKDVQWAYYRKLRDKTHRLMMTGLFSLLGAIMLTNWSWIAVAFYLMIPVALWTSAYLTDKVAQEVFEAYERGMHPHKLEEAVQYFTMDTTQHEAIRSFLKELLSTPHSQVADLRDYYGDIAHVLERFKDHRFISQSPWYCMLHAMITPVVYPRLSSV